MTCHCTVSRSSRARRPWRFPGPKTPARGTVVVVGHNNWPELEMAIVSALGHSYLDVEVVVVDNDSADATPPKCRAALVSACDTSGSPTAATVGVTTAISRNPPASSSTCLTETTCCHRP